MAKDKKISWISLLTNNEYLPGILVLNKSLEKVGTEIPLLLLLSSNISSRVRIILEKNNIKYKIITNDVNNPTNVNPAHRWYSTYSKLLAFNQTQFDKIIFLDADMLILRNIDDLFDMPHMSAVDSGSMLPRKKELIHMNSGLIVIEPDNKLFKDMSEKIGKIEKLEPEGTNERPKYGSDQDFLNAYFFDWTKKTELHLDHKYNMIHYQLDEYNSCFNFTIEDGPRPISILHFASYIKPWTLDEKALKELNTNPKKKLETDSLKLWLDYYNNIEIK